MFVKNGCWSVYFLLLTYCFSSFDLLQIHVSSCCRLPPRGCIVRQQMRPLHWWRRFPSQPRMTSPRQHRNHCSLHLQRRWMALRRCRHWPQSPRHSHLQTSFHLRMHRLLCKRHCGCISSLLPMLRSQSSIAQSAHWCGGPRIGTGIRWYRKLLDDFWSFPPRPFPPIACSRRKVMRLQTRGMRFPRKGPITFYL